jgi:hypothetical protein
MYLINQSTQGVSVKTRMALLIVASAVLLLLGGCVVKAQPAAEGNSVIEPLTVATSSPIGKITEVGQPKQGQIQNAEHRGTVTITTWGYAIHGMNGRPKGQDYHLNVHDGKYAMDDEPWGLGPDQLGTDPYISRAMLKLDSAQRIMSMLEAQVLPLIHDGYKMDIMDSMGHHRALVLSRAFGEKLQAAGFTVVYKDRDVTRSWVQTPKELELRKRYEHLYLNLDPH